MGFNSVFKGLNYLQNGVLCVRYTHYYMSEKMYMFVIWGKGSIHV